MEAVLITSAQGYFAPCGQRWEREWASEGGRETVCCAALDSRSSCIRESESAEAHGNSAVFRSENTLGVQPVYVMCYQRNSWKDRSAKMTILSSCTRTHFIPNSYEEHKRKNLQINKSQNDHKISPCDLCAIFKVVWGHVTLIDWKYWHMCHLNEHIFLWIRFDGAVDTCLWCERPRFESHVRHQCVPEQDT